MKLPARQKEMLFLLMGWQLFLIVGTSQLQRIQAAQLYNYQLSRWERAFTNHCASILWSLLIGQLMLLPLWAALAAQPLRKRLPLALAAAAALLLGWAYATKRAILDNFYGANWLEVFLLWAVLFLVLSLAAALVRYLLGWRIANQAADSAPEPLSHKQFSLGDALLWTTGIALTLALAAWILEPADDWIYGSIFRSAGHRLINICYFLPPALACVAATAFTGWRRALWLALAVVLAVVASAFEIWLGVRRFGYPLSLYLRELGFDLAMIVIYRLSTAGGILLTLAILSFGGWRLSRLPAEDSGPSPPAAQSLAAAPPEPLQ